MRVPSRVVAAFNAIAAAAAFTGVAMLFLVEHRGPDEFVYFTTQSNTLAGCCFLWAAVAPWLPRRAAGGPAAVLGGAVTLYVMVTFLVFHLILANPASGFSDGSVQFGPVQNVLLHTVTPLLALLDWLLVGVERPRWRWAAAWLTYPLAYLVFTLALGYADVGIVAAVLCLVFWLLGLLVVAVGRLGRREPSRAGFVEAGTT